MTPGPAIIWFRRDLRLIDNPALQAAAKGGRSVVPLFVLDEESPGVRPLGEASRWWLNESLEFLGRSLRRRGARLCLRAGPVAKVLPQVARECGATLVTWNRTYDAAGMAQDRDVAAALGHAGVRTERHSASLLVEPGAMLNRQGGPYRVFTPFWNRLRIRCAPPSSLAPPERLASGPQPAGESLDDLRLNTVDPERELDLLEAWSPGEAAAITHLSEFAEEALASYDRDRDLWWKYSTSGLSPHLAWGEISPWRAWRAAAALADSGGPGAAGGEAFLRQLAWREFNHHLLFHFPSLATENWRSRFDHFPWRDDRRGYWAWTRGETGVPVVDAAMRELLTTGRMHNRLRMVAASYLVKHLMMHWRFGERWFWRMLVDADLANNAGNWQWVAGSGVDAAPFFRIFNPVRQGEEFDPSGRSVRHWVPELDRLPDRWIHRPWEAPQPVLREANVTLGETYPHPIVDHAQARQRALAAYEALPR